jgi:signal transduction histidine kinase/DNA-binding response OmpR family regulator
VTSLRILIVDDSAVVRRGIETVLSSRENWIVCGQAVDGLDAIDKAEALRPDVIVMDVSMPRMDGLQATREIRKNRPEAKIVIVTQNDTTITRQQAVAAKAHGFVAKASLANDLPREIARLTTNTPAAEGAKPKPHTAESPEGALFSGGGEMAKLIREFDWSQTPLGPIATWSPALRMMVRFMLPNPFPQLLWWGPELCCLYNDAYSPVLGAKHPWALGRPTTQVWREVWHVLEPLIDAPFRGGPATWMDDIPLEVNRRGFVEETHFTIAYSPVPDESVPSGIGGVLATVHEISEKVVGQRRVDALRDLGTRSGELRTAEEACAIASETLSKHSLDIPFALLYLIDPKTTSAVLASSVGVDPEDRGCLKSIFLEERAAEATWPLHAAMETESIQTVTGLDTILANVPPGYWSEPPNMAAVVPIRSTVPHQLAGFLVAGISPRLRFDDGYRSFLELVSAQIATTIANARAYEEERKRAEALAEIDRAKTTFFSNVSHEFRTPLTLILSPLEDLLSRNQTDLPPGARKQLELANRNGARLLRLVNTLLDFSRIEAERVQAVYLATDLARFTAELASVFDSAVQRAGMRLVVDCQPLGDPVYVDREMWEKIVLNLVSNAFKFTFEGEISVSLRKTGASVELRVEDTGVGIPREELSRLFDRFHRVPNTRSRTHEGSGIGLALVHELVKLHSGSIRVESELGKGSAFTVCVPLGKDHIPAGQIGGERTLSSTATGATVYVEEAPRWLPERESYPTDAAIEKIAGPFGKAPPTDGKRARVLLADDNADMRSYVARMLAEYYDVETVSNGRAALEAIRRKAPDLVLSDVMMPEMDGFGLLREIRSDAALNRIPIILLSARAGEESRAEGLDMGADDYLVKPFSARELMARVQGRLELARARKQADAALSDSEQRLRALVNASSYTVYRMSPDWKEMRQLDGRGFISDMQEPSRDWIENYIHPEDQPLVLSAIQKAIQSKSLFELEHRVRRPDGTLGWTLSRAIPLLDEAGEIVEWFGAASDVTPRKEAEEKYKKLAETLDAEVRARTTQLEEQNLEILMQSEQLRDLSWRLLRAQDEERRHIARELHDSAGQTLAVLGVAVQRLVKKAGSSAPNLASDAGTIHETVRQLQNEIRTASYLLHPPLLDESGLDAALNWYTQGLQERSGLSVSVDISADLERLPRDLELAVFRLVQEALTNIHRHSGSKTASIKLARETGVLTIAIEDQGKGMSAAKLAEIQSHGSGVGIQGIRERLRQYRGELKIDSDSSGTRVAARIPVN